MSEILQQAINGLSIGSIYALIALGYTMTYGIIKLINFAHGDIYMFGAYMGLIGLKNFGLPFPIALVFSIVVTAILGFVIEKIAYRPLRNATRISALITTIGVSLLIRNVIIYFFSAQAYSFPEIKLLPDLVLGQIVITGQQFLIFIITIVSLIILSFLVYKTKFGAAMRAVSTDSEASNLMGINTNRVISITFVLGCILAATAGVLVGVNYSRVTPTMGVNRGLKAFIAAVFGGIGSLEGAVIGGFIIGLIETISGVFNLSQWSEAIVYLILILVLILKPQGLLGKKGGEKV